MRCAVPQTGSSGRPTFGAKTRIATSDPLPPGAVAMTAVLSKALTSVISGRNAASVRILEDRHISERRDPVSTGDAPSARSMSRYSSDSARRHVGEVDGDAVAHCTRHAPVAVSPARNVTMSRDRLFSPRDAMCRRTRCAAASVACPAPGWGPLAVKKRSDGSLSEAPTTAITSVFEQAADSGEVTGRSFIGIAHHESRIAAERVRREGYDLE